MVSIGKSRLLLAGVLGALALGLAGVGRAGDGEKGAEGAASPDDLIKVLVPYIGGEWRINASWSGGQPLEGRQTFDWGIAKKFVVAKTYVKGKDGTEYQRYETFFGVKDKKLAAWGFVFDGHVDVTEFTVEGKKLTGTRPIAGADGAPGGTLKQVIDLVKPDEFRWTVTIERDGQTQTLIDASWMRDTGGKAK
jgi:hypothetical protein